MSEKPTRKDFIKLYKKVLKGLYKSLEQEKEFGLEDEEMAKEIQKAIDEMEETLRKAV